MRKLNDDLTKLALRAKKERSNKLLELKHSNMQLTKQDQEILDSLYAAKEAKQRQILTCLNFVLMKDGNLDAVYEKTPGLLPLAQVEDLHQTMPFDPLCVKQLVHVFDT